MEEQVNTDFDLMFCDDGEREERTARFIREQMACVEDAVRRAYE